LLRESRICGIVTTFSALQYYVRIVKEAAADCGKDQSWDHVTTR